MLWLRRLWCWLRWHKPGIIESHWDMVGDPKFDYWLEYHCPVCGKQKQL